MHTTTVVKPVAPRYVVTQQDGTLRVTLPSRKKWLAIIPPGLFVVVWAALMMVVAIGGLLFLVQLLARPETLVSELFPLAFFAIWIGLFSVGGLIALYNPVWNLAGREVIDVSRQRIRLSRVIPGWGRSRDYLAEHIRDLRVSPQFIPRLYRYRVNLFSLGEGRGQLAFDYGARTIRFAFFSGEEQRILGSERYAATHAADLLRYQAVLVVDNGSGRITGMSTQGQGDLLALWRSMFGAIPSLGPFVVTPVDKDGTDHLSFLNYGVPSFNYDQEIHRYDITHHSELDAFDHVLPRDVEQMATVMAVNALQLADLPKLLPRHQMTKAP